MSSETLPTCNLGHKMQAFVSLLWLLVMSAGTAYAQAVQVQRLDIEDYGTYSLNREISGRDEQGISLGTASNIQHTATQRTVPAQIGVTFGFRYKIVGKPDGAAVNLRKVIVFPPPGLQTSASSKQVSKAEFDVEAKIGETNSELYTLEDNFELIPGTWVLEMWHGSRKLVAQSFKLDKQAEKTETEKPDRSKPDSRKPDRENTNRGCVRDCDGL
jgi:hypothetical protein